MIETEKDIPPARYQVGDVVQVVDEPYDACPFKWIDDMDEYCGHVAVITRVRWNEALDTWAYYLDISKGMSYQWCENCFADVPELEESEEDASVLFV